MDLVDPWASRCYWIDDRCQAGCPPRVAKSWGLSLGKLGTGGSEQTGRGLSGSQGPLDIVIVLWSGWSVQVRCTCVHYLFKMGEGWLGQVLIQGLW